MSRKFIAGKSRVNAIRQCPWAVMLVKVEGGYMAFRSFTDYDTWKNQR